MTTPEGAVSQKVNLACHACGEPMRPVGGDGWECDCGWVWPPKGAMEAAGKALDAINEGRAGFPGEWRLSVIVGAACEWQRAQDAARLATLEDRLAPRCGAVIARDYGCGKRSGHAGPHETLEERRARDADHE
jgi:hypothetical protein